MSYKCAVFGHKYGETEVDRERTEDGKEVIITVRETEACKRCGDTRVLSENKEVTTMETAADIVGDDIEEGESRSGNPTATQQPPRQSSGSPQSQAPAPEPTDEGRHQSPAPETPTETDAVDPETDDGVILDDDDEPEREEGEWPDDAEEQADTEPDESGPEWPEEHESSDGESASWELDSEITPHPETEQSPSRTSGTLTIPEGQFYCPNCEFTTPVESSSLREGDFCPECRKGTLEHNRD